MIEKFGAKIKNPLDLLKSQSEILSTEISRWEKILFFLFILKDLMNSSIVFYCSLDNLLNGGIQPGQIYEICGISSSGKSQLCLVLTANIAAKSDGIIHYIDTRKNFSATRIQMILSAKKLNDEV